MKSLKSKAFIYGLLFTFIIAVISLLGSKLPFLDKIGALTIAILIAILYRHFKGYPEAYRSGIAFSSKRLLKLAIILYGLKLNIYDVIGKGSANMITGLFGGMGGCAMIGQSVINVKSGANSRLSTFTAGIVLIFMIIVLGGLVVQVPMPILAGIMVMVSVGTFDWNSFKYIKKAPKTDAVVMLITVIIVLMTHNLALGVVAGVVFSALFFATKISKVEVISEEFGKINRLSFKGQIFFVSIDSMMEQINFEIENSTIELNFNNAHLWDDSAVDAIDTIVRKFEEKNNIVRVEKLNSDSRKVVSELSQLNENHLN
ncbi:TPA: putative sulfate exporter family transporter [Staphylococcus aureus]|nr:putative sulfate exporter family transporter [Staphylococcus aureus]